MSTYPSPIFKVLSALLSYPTPQIAASGSVMRQILSEEPGFSSPLRAALYRLIDDLEKGDLYDAQERYVDHFDRSRALSLYLFEHVHGESRDRGQAMVDLLALYEKRDLTLAKGELPDFLPAVLEYCALLPPAEAQAMLEQVAHILAALLRRLEKRQSPYAPVFTALCALSGAPAVEQPEDAEVEAELHPDNFAALDRIWEEEAVTFGPGKSGAGACSSETLIAKLRHSRRSVPQASHEGDRQ